MHGRMNARTTHRSDRDAVREAMQGFYEQHPYPPPPSDLESYRRRGKTSMTEISRTMSI